jgi:hypothetical protein
MKKVKNYKGFIIALDKEGNYNIFTKDEWILGNGCRYSEFETESINEAIDFINSY